MTDSAQGIDVSSYQPVLTTAQLKGLAFAFAKATDGTDTDPNFTANWKVLKSSGVHRGCYHELHSGSAGPQADYFLSVVKSAGLDAGDMLAVVASDYTGVTDAEVKAFCDQVQAAARTSPVLVYSDLSVAATLPSCTGYDLWVAWPSDTAPASVAPWQTWRLWQWDETTLDRDAYNGTAKEMSAWIDSIANPAGWTFGPPQNLTATGGFTSVRLTWSEPAGAPQTPAEYNVFIYDGTTTDESSLVKSYPRAVKTTEFEGGSLVRDHTYTAHVVAEGPNGTRVGKDVYASVTFATG
jgi:hypothetical protein